VVENIFSINGFVSHEIVFVYAGRLDPQPVPEGAVLTEVDGSVLPVVWRALNGGDEPLPLHPAAAAALAERALA
jgi:hypothetical protein